MRWLPLLLLLPSCISHTVETQQAVIDTRGVPIVQVVIEGPGGDLVPVDHYLVQTTAYELDHGILQVLLTFITCAGIVFALREAARLGKR